MYVGYQCLRSSINVEFRTENLVDSQDLWRQFLKRADVFSLFRREKLMRPAAFLLSVPLRRTPLHPPEALAY